MHLGIHCSVRNGYLAAVEEARLLGLKCFQMLPYRRHHVPVHADFAAFRAARHAAGVERLLVHSRFLPALSTTSEKMRGGTVSHLVSELKMARALEGDAYVLHVGAFAPGSSFAEGLALFARSLAEARAQVEPLPVLIENVPGGGRRMGGTLEELDALLAAARVVWPETGVCLDTAHAWAAGVDLDPVKVSARFGSALKAWHLNDTAAERGSNLESHEHLGQGKIGEKALGDLLSALAQTDVTVILETPKGGDFDRQNVEWARRRS